MNQRPPEPLTYEQKWQAIGQLMVAHGMENADLGEKLGGLHKDTIRKARSGQKPLSEERMQMIPAVFGARDYTHLLNKAKALPSLSEETVMDAIYRHAAHRGKPLKTVAQEAGYRGNLFANAHVGIGAAYAIATRSFGLQDTASMVRKAKNLPPAERRVLRLPERALPPQDNPAISDETLIAAMRKRQSDLGRSDRAMAAALGLSRSQFLTTLKQGHFHSDEERQKLPAIFGLGDLEQVADLSFATPTVQWPWKVPLPAKPARPVAEAGNTPPPQAEGDTGYWQHLVNSAALSRKYGKDGGSI